jgi:hypothetical protein
VHHHQKVLDFQVFRRNPSFLDFPRLEIFPYHSTNATNASIVPEETLDVRSFRGSADPAFLVTDKLEPNLQELISSEDTCRIIFNVVVSIFHGDVLMDYSAVISVGCC